MQANRSKNTKPELMLRLLLRDAGFPGYRLHWKKAPGHPDIAYPGRRVAVFVNGCFWHRCPHCSPPIPKSNSLFWASKFASTVERDGRKTRELREVGWTVVVIWECELKRDPIGSLAKVTQVLAHVAIGRDESTSRDDSGRGSASR